MRPLVPPIVLLGPPGAGKSTVGPRLAERLGFAFVDLDERAHADRFAEDGEPRFRVREHLALRAALDGGSGAVVIAAGAGVVGIDENLPLLERSLCLVVDVDDDTSLQRLQQGLDGGRPWLRGVLDPRATLMAREAGRASRRAGLAAATGGALVDGRGPIDVVVDALVAAVDTAHLPRSADPDVSDVLRTGPSRGRSFVVADPRVTDLVEANGTDVDLALHLAPRDKRLGAVERLLGAFVGAGVGRHDTIVAVGGGVLLDVVGLAAALHHRGTPWRAVPTTLLAMVDAGLGGKTAVDIDADHADLDVDRPGHDGDGDGPLRIRNAAGAFHAPASSCVWPGFLRTLDEDNLRQGRAEMLKHALLVGDDVMEAATAPLDAALLAKSRGIKRAVVERDPHERHLRFALNLGHTVAHGLESRLGLAHGDAVLHGLRAALHVSEVAAGLQRDVADGARAAIARLAPPALPALDDDDLAALAAACRRDKKGGRVVLLRARGAAVLADIDDSVLLEAVRTLW